MGRDVLQRALRAGDLAAVRAAAAAQDTIDLEDAAAIVVLMAGQAPGSFQAAAVRWIARYATERRPGLDGLHYAAQVLHAVDAEQGGAGDELMRLARRPRAGAALAGPAPGAAPTPAVGQTSVAWKAEEAVVYDPGAHVWHRPGCPRLPERGGEPLEAGGVLRFVNAPGSCSSCRATVNVTLSTTADAPVRDRGLRPAASPPSRRRASAVRQGRMPGR